MTVLELTIFLIVYRAMQPVAVDGLSDTLSGWFECLIAPDDLTGAVANMVSRGWLIVVAGGLFPTEAGRLAARPLIHGIIQMLDQGTRLIDVALMMAVLRLTKWELDHGNDHH